MYSALSTDRLEAAALVTKLLKLDAEKIAQLGAFAAAARTLLNFLDQQAPAAEVKWSALQRRAISHAAALDTLAKGLAASGLPADALISDLGDILAAHAEWLAATEALSSERAQVIRDPISADSVRGTVVFAQEIWSRYEDFGLFLLADGWTERIATLRQHGLAAAKAAEATSDILAELKRLGLTNFATVARHQDADAVQSAAAEMLEAEETLSSYLDFATSRFTCLDHPVV
jgi:hypothetical protein